MLVVIVWWVALDLIALLALPIAWRLLRPLPDRGLVLARLIGLLLSAYLFWLLVSLGILHNTRANILAVLLLVGGASFLVVRRHGTALWADLTAQRTVWLIGEILFGLALCTFCLFRAYNPDIAATEKPMEFGFINATLRSRTFPPNDPWLSGYSISYYYFGYVMIAMLTRLTGLPSSVTFNLAGATWFALTVVASFSLAYNLAKASEVRQAVRMGAVRLGHLLAGLLGAFFVALMGNLEGIFEIVRACGWGTPGLWAWLDIKGMPLAASSVPCLPDDPWWWWRASRVIHDKDALGNSIEVIDEFPFFSFLLGDNHPHVLALPFVLLALSVVLALLLKITTPGVDGHSPSRKGWWGSWGRMLEPMAEGPYEVLLIALVLGALGFLNTWDYPIALGMVIVACALGLYRTGRPTGDWLQKSLLLGLVLGILGVLLYAPFYVSFRSQAGGIGWVGAIKTRWHQYVLMFGVFLWAILGLALYSLREILRQRGAAPRLPSLGMAIGLGAGAAALLFIGRGWWTAALTAVLGGGALALAIWGCAPARGGTLDEAPRSALSASACFALLMAAGGLALTGSVEFLFLRDSFGTRMNTVFKFYYQGWALMGLASAYAAYGVWRSAARANWVGRMLRGVWSLVLVGLALCGASYTLVATYSKADGFRGTPTLDGTRYVARYRPAEYEAIRWLQAHAAEGAVMLEAPGGSYTEYNWVSAHTGIPTVLGWGGHELQWRGSYDEPGRREGAIALIYQSPDEKQTLALLEAYGIDYVYLGPLERAKYHPSPAALQKLDRLMPRVFEKDEIVIYSRVPGIAGRFAPE